MTIERDLIKELTDEWVEMMSLPENQKTGFFAYAASIGLLPNGVDPNDDRVKEIIQKIAKERSELDG